MVKQQLFPALSERWSHGILAQRCQIGIRFQKHHFPRPCVELTSTARLQIVGDHPEVARLVSTTKLMVTVETGWVELV